MGYSHSQEKKQNRQAARKTGFLKAVRGRIVRYCKKNEAEHRFFCSILEKKDASKKGRVDGDTAGEDLIPE